MILFTQFQFKIVSNFTKRLMDLRRHTVKLMIMSN